VTEAGTVAVTDHPFRDLEIERSILEPEGYAVAEHQCATADDVAEACVSAVGVLNTYAPMPAEVIGRLESCRAIARYGVGLDTIDLDAAAARGMRVSNVPDYCVEEVALHTIALLLAAHRRIARGDRLVRGGGWGALAAGPVRRLEGPAPRDGRLRPHPALGRHEGARARPARGRPRPVRGRRCLA
jgi:D-3-phosphoglycerate dehydrogenase